MGADLHILVRQLPANSKEGEFEGGGYGRDPLGPDMRGVWTDKDERAWTFGSAARAMFAILVANDDAAAQSRQEFIQLESYQEETIVRMSVQELRARIEPAARAYADADWHPVEHSGDPTAEERESARQNHVRWLTAFADRYEELVKRGCDPLLEVDW